MSSFPSVNTRGWGEETSHTGPLNSLSLALSGQDMSGNKKYEMGRRNVARVVPTGAKQLATFPSKALSKVPTRRDDQDQTQNQNQDRDQDRVRRNDVADSMRYVSVQSHCGVPFAGQSRGTMEYHFPICAQACAGGPFLRSGVSMSISLSHSLTVIPKTRHYGR